MHTINYRQTDRPYPLGVTTQYGYTFFSAVMKKGKDCGILLYDKKTGKESRIPFGEENKYGSIFSIAVKDLDTKRYAYNFYDAGDVFTDPYAKVIKGHEKWGRCADTVKGGFLTEDYDWEGDKPLKTSYEESILYCLNVRAFTKHKSSAVENKGTYRGVAQKAEYLKELGITGVELMPVYEFDETEQFGKGKDKAASTMEDAVRQLGRPIEDPAAENKNKYNCWGYIEGYYFAPKAAYGSGQDTVAEFKDMVKELHKNGIEVILQFYFPHTVKQGLILEAVKYWVLEYHIDGIHLKGENIPVQAIATEPLLTDTKIFYDDFPYGEIYAKKDLPVCRNLASYNDSYMYTARRFLKGDENMLGYFLELQRKNPSYGGVINYITNYYGFTLADMVSYEKKHNMKNGENNQDGNDYNCTWNCGMEGITRKKSIVKLRVRQMKNALSMLFTAQGTPLIYSGDEMGNTRYGNNNPYCQDNETGYVKWTMNGTGRQIYEYLKHLIALRKNHPVLRNAKELKILDYIGCGYPDLSYHGEEAWRPDLNNYSRHVGVMYCGCYAKKNRKEDDNFFYIAYNMHWLSHTFALPKLPKNMNWYLIADTGAEEAEAAKEEPVEIKEEQIRVEVEARTVKIYIAKQEEGYLPDKNINYVRSAF